MSVLWPDFVQHDVMLDDKTTLALPAMTALYARITHINQLQALAKFKVRRFVLGGGSNLVLTGDFDGLMLHMGIGGCTLISEDDKAWYVQAGAGECWHDFVAWTLDQGWPGLENLVLIPGTVGAAPVQNIGAYGLEMGERFFSLHAVDMASGDLRSFTREECRFAYRNSLFKQEGWSYDGCFAITDVTFRLPKIWEPRIHYADLAAELDERTLSDRMSAHEVAKAVIRVRQRKLPDPATLRNAGSFFQNPMVDEKCAHLLKAKFPDLPTYPQPDGTIKLAAGWMIEQAGWKGRSLGAVGMYEKQALVLINHHQATGKDVLALLDAVRADVRRTFGVELLPEPVFL